MHSAFPAALGNAWGSPGRGYSGTVEAPSISEARRLLAQGRLEEARAVLERAITAAPLDPAGWIALADCQLTARRPDLALRVCDTGLRRIGANAGLLCAKARVLQSAQPRGGGRSAPTVR